MSEPILCYVKRGWAWFTTAPLKDQWGDDWNDAPYEHNAGEPYDWAPHQDMPEYALVRVAFDGEFDEPCDPNRNSSWSVQAINNGAISWLRPPDYSSAHKVCIHAGTPLSQFRELVWQAGGEVYERVVPS